MLYLLAIALCIGADQAVKYYVVTHLELYESAPLLPGVVELFHIRNTGGGFSILAGHTWVLTVLTAVLMVGIAWALVKKYFPHPMAMWTLTAILGGGLGNLIDRVRLGYVVDMFNFQFISYPVFNVADILVVCGTIGFAAYYLLLPGALGGGPAVHRHLPRLNEPGGGGPGQLRQGRGQKAVQPDASALTGDRQAYRFHRPSPPGMFFPSVCRGAAGSMRQSRW